MEVKKLNYDSLFGSDFTDVNKSVSTKESKYNDENLYQPKLDDAKKGVYTALIRFLPNPMDYSKSIINKLQYYFKDVDGDNGVRIDSPETIGQKCPIGQLRAKLWNTNIASNIDCAKKNAGKENKYWTLVYIYKDPQHPELENTVKVFRFGKKLYEKYIIASSPNELEGEEGVAANHLLLGKNLRLVIKSKDGYVNYDDSQFGAKEPLKIGSVAIDNSDKGRKLLAEMYAGAPDISNYDYKPMDEGTIQKVAQNIRTYDRLLPDGEASSIATKWLASVGIKDDICDAPAAVAFSSKTIDSTDFSKEISEHDKASDTADDAGDNAGDNTGKDDDTILDEIGDELDL